MSRFGFDKIHLQEVRALKAFSENQVEGVEGFGKLVHVHERGGRHYQRLPEHFNAMARTENFSAFPSFRRTKCTAAPGTTTANESSNSRASTKKASSETFAKSLKLPKTAMKIINKLIAKRRLLCYNISCHGRPYSNQGTALRK